MKTPGVTAKISANVSDFFAQKRPFHFHQRQQVTVDKNTLFSFRLLNLDWGLKESNKTWIETATKSKSATVANSVAAVQNQPQQQLCPSEGLAQEFASTEAEPIADSSTLTSSINALPSASLMQSPTAGHNFLPNRILQRLQNLFSFSNTDEKSVSPTSLPVLVVQRQPSKFEVWLNSRLVATLPDKQQANFLLQRLTSLLSNPNLDASQLRPGMIDGIPMLMMGNRLLFAVEKEITAQFNNRSADLIAIDWINNLRTALNAPAIPLLEAQVQMYGLTAGREKFTGLASWYGPYFHGRVTANGETYNKYELTAAHKTLPFNTYLQVTNLETGKKVIVRINDRGPYIPPRSLDLSLVASRCIGSQVSGVVEYEAVIMHPTFKQQIAIANPDPTPRRQSFRDKLTILSKF
ncbi:MAG: septal ring lytic transglycosylase RlpA family protein [Nostocaceae cyanobacterium]|nr:septal ring lytic transglycosylase RlpA family protein [Nostocaceae cyanobacterium]